MKKPLLSILAALACTLCAISGASAQTATLSFNDGVGAPNAGTYGAGQVFSFNVMLNFAPGGAVTNLEGLSYWLQQNSGAPFNFSITNRNLSASLFADAQSPGITYPQAMTPSNASDLGAALAVGVAPLGAGNYFIATITISISKTAAEGTYVLGSTFTGGKTSFISDNGGHTFAIPQAIYTVTVVPETGSTMWLLSAAGAGLLGFARTRRQSA